MVEIIALFHCFDQTIAPKTVRQLECIATAILAMTGRVTMLGVSRWTLEKCSYRTIQRFYGTIIPWPTLNWLLIKKHLLTETTTPFLIAGDETVVSKAGRHTFGLDRFFSSLRSKVIPGLSFFAFSVINPVTRQSSVVLMEQLQREQSTATSKTAQKDTAVKGEKKKGRPLGSQNKNRQDIELPAHLQNLQRLLQSVLDLLGDQVPVAYCLLDGAFGNNNALQMVRRCELSLVSKLRSDSALYLPFTGEQKKRGARRKYGDKLNYASLPDSYCVSEQIEEDIETRIFHIIGWHRAFSIKLNVVILVKRNLQTKKQAHVILFSDDLQLAWDKLLAYYKLRFQIEFNFRDAKQYWGLEDFMNIKERPVYNAANLAMFMGNLSQVLRLKLSVASESVLDLKTAFRGHWYAQQLLKLLPEPLDPLLIDQFFAKLETLGAIHPSEVS